MGSHCPNPTLSVCATTSTQLTSWWTTQASVSRWLILRPSAQLSSMLSTTQVSLTIILGKVAKREIIKWSPLGRSTSMTKLLGSIPSRQVVLHLHRLWQLGAIAHAATIFGRSSIQLTLSWSSPRMYLSSHTIRLKKLLLMLYLGQQISPQYALSQKESTRSFQYFSRVFQVVNLKSFKKNLETLATSMDSHSKLGTSKN